MLTYHPIHDPSHCIFRMLCLCYDVEDIKIPIDLIRILDFYILFPHLLASTSLPRDMFETKKIFKKIKIPYENLPSPTRLMFELSSIQDLTLKSLMAKGLLDRNEFESGYIYIHKERLPTEILQLIDGSAFRYTDWYKSLVLNISKIPLKGSGGLKERSGLLEYRYDNV